MGTIQLVIALLAQIVETVLPQLASDTTTKLVTSIIATLENILPDVIKAGQELATSVQNIIAALKGANGVTPDQWAQLDAFEKQIDADFNAAAADEGFSPPTTPDTTT